MPTYLVSAHARLVIVVHVVVRRFGRASASRGPRGRLKWDQIDRVGQARHLEKDCLPVCVAAWILVSHLGDLIGLRNLLLLLWRLLLQVVQ